MKKFLVAGCGIGGISAALNLAKNGYDVTVFEKCERASMGHDWHDTIYKSAFEYAGFPRPNEENFTPHRIGNYINPAKDVKVIVTSTPCEDIGYIDRKFLINHLVDYAEKCGVKFLFGICVKSLIIENKQVVGLTAIVSGKETNYSADLVIDACGIESPLKKDLPSESGISPQIDKRDTLFVYRAYFENKSAISKPRPEFNIHFFHCRKQGLAWTIDCPGYTDILVGGFGSLTKKDIENALADFRKEYPNMSDTPIRGGTVAKIPVRRTLPLIVWNGYVLVGDSASMIEPLSGSGISLSLCGGKILADTVINASVPYTIDVLWGFQYNYFKDYGNAQLFSDTIKYTLSRISADDIDYLFQKRILTGKELSMNFDSGYKFNEIASKTLWLIAKPKLCASVLKAAKRMLSIKKIVELMPEKYDKKAVEVWINKYEGGM